VDAIVFTCSPLFTGEVPTPVPEPERPERVPTRRRYLMCPPTYFEVGYAINPWMDTGRAVDRSLAMRQWQKLHDTYAELGHRVDVLEPVAGLPDMVFAANGALVLGDRALGARFRHAERADEAVAHAAWLRDVAGLSHVTEPVHENEGEGDFLVVGDTVLAGHGFRTALSAHAEAEAVFERPFVSLLLVDSRFYHLDTAIAVLDDTTIAYYPGAFTAGGRRVLQALFPDAIVATEADACVLGLNVVSDGKHVVVPSQAQDLIDQLRRKGFTPIPIDLSELLKAGGSAKCCTLELHKQRLMSDDPAIHAGSPLTTTERS
jgi:N-dimethylarginine dimethylaminohydrolase